MAKSRYRPLLDREPTGQDPTIGKEFRDKGLLGRVNGLLRPEGFVLRFSYQNQDDPDKVGPYEIKLERYQSPP